MKNYRKLLKFLKGHEKLLGLGVVTIFFATLLEAFQLPMLVPLFDRIFNDQDIIVPNKNLPEFLDNFVLWLNSIEPNTMFWAFLIIMPAILLIKNVLIFFYSYIMNDVSQRIMRDIRNELYAKIHNLSLDYFSEKRTGELISRITYDVNAIENALSYGCIDLFRQSFLIIIYIAVTFSIYPKAATILFVIFPMIAIPMSLIGKRLKKLTRGRQEKMADINSLLLETIGGVKLVKAFHTEKYEVKRFKETNYAFYKIWMKGVKRLIMISPMTEIFGTLCSIFIIAWLGRMVMTGELSTGIFLLFIASIMSLISPVKKLGNVNAINQQAMAASERIYAILDEPITVKESNSPVQLSEIKESIELRNVTFHYNEESGAVLKNINFKINRGELVAIVGPTGVGKTTLVNLIPRFYDPEKGDVLIDGKNVKDVSFESLRRQIGIVTQESILFNDTVRANIAYGQENAPLDEIKEASKKAHAHEFVSKFPDGYDTVIGDRGFRLSGGEKQRVSIARAIIKNAPILILDEATSQLDSESEKFVQDALDKLMVGRTVIAIAHRLSTIQKAHKIIVLDKGEMVGIGTHKELLQDCPLYQRLCQIQFQSGIHASS